MRCCVFLLLALALPLALVKGAPSIVFILTDDQDASMGGDWNMPQLSQLLARRGINFTACISNLAVCCPARVSMLTGQCSHNTGVISNDPPLGSITRFIERGLENITAPYILQQAGYRTGHLGKFLNFYGRSTPASYIPAGYDRWFAFIGPNYYNWSVSNEGVAREFGSAEQDYSTDVLTAEAVKFIHQYREDERPFFLFLAPYAPHLPAKPAQRHIGKLAGLEVPRGHASYNESKRFIKTKATPVVKNMAPVRLKKALEMDSLYQARAETLLAVDDMIAGVIQALGDIGQLDNTYIMYASDNGFKLGHHRKEGKSSPYEEDVRVPLYVSGPGVPPGVQLPHLVSNVDYLPTWLELAGVPDPYAPVRDGKSFSHLLLSDQARERSPDAFRIGVLIEKLIPTATDRYVSPFVPVADPFDDVFEAYRLPQDAWLNKSLNGSTTRPGAMSKFNTMYYALRIQSTAGSYKFIQYPEGYELYDLQKDPYEVNNTYRSASLSLTRYFRTTLDALKPCRGGACSVENVTLLIQAQQGEDVEPPGTRRNHSPGSNTNRRQERGPRSQQDSHKRKSPHIDKKRKDNNRDHAS